MACSKPHSFERLEEARMTHKMLVTSLRVSSPNHPMVDSIKALLKIPGRKRGGEGKREEERGGKGKLREDKLQRTLF